MKILVVYANSVDPQCHSQQRLLWLIILHFSLITQGWVSPQTAPSSIHFRCLAPMNICGQAEPGLICGFLCLVLNAVAPFSLFCHSVFDNRGLIFLCCGREPLCGLNIYS